MSKFFKSAVAATLASAVLATTFAPNAEAGRRDRAFIGGLAAGIIGTAIIANERRRYRGHHGYHDHGPVYRDCYWKKRKVWSDYHGRRVWRKVKVCY